MSAVIFMTPHTWAPHAEPSAVGDVVLTLKSLILPMPS